MPAAVFLTAELLFYDYESLPDFVQQGIKIRGQHHLLRIDHNIRRCSGPGPAKPYGFPETAFDPVALNRSA